MLPFGQARIRSFRVVPSLPAPLQPLMEIAHNLWWAWSPRAIDLFVRLDRDLWETSGHNPVRMLGQIPQETLERAASDQSFLHALSLVHATLQAHVEQPGWFHARRPDLAPSHHDKHSAPRPGGFGVAYFSAEFGLTECLQIYSGGLGVLAGDHLKSASELALPLVAVGLLYRSGYFHQYLNSDGWQQETYRDLDLPNQPVHRVIDPQTGQQYRVQVDLPGRPLTIGVWRVNVGRVPLYLLDTNYPENQRDDRDITKNLYGGDVEMRIKQEIVLGIGGVRALSKLGISPTVFHMNEGHSAFLSLERIRMLREQHGLSFAEAKEAAAAGQIFTTHTPVPAGIDRFAPDVMDRYFRGWQDGLGVDMHGLLALGRERPHDHAEFFSMAVLAIRTARWCNGVSALHGKVSRQMWKSLWPNIPENEVPIGHVTNGVHARSWIKSDLLDLLDRHLPSSWRRDPSDHSVWSAVRDIPDEELWGVRQRTRERLITWARRRLREQLQSRGAGPDQIDLATAALDPNILTIGFARRFATYKRGTLLLRNLERLHALLEDPDRPLQILVAGKSHPADGGGKELIRDLVRYARSDGKSQRIVFLEDYDMGLARRLVQGCDIWLNNPRRGMEASGTSGMKAAMNGVIHVSILDGWWDEAYHSSVGFAIGRGEAYEDHEMEDEIESRALYDLLERHIVPEFYDRDAAGLPRRWIKRMKRCIERLAPVYNTNRMVAEYADRMYFESHDAASRLAADGMAGARSLSSQMARLREHWGRIRIEDVRADIGAQAPIRTMVKVSAVVDLGGLNPDDLRVQVYHGLVNSSGDLTHGAATDMAPEAGGDGLQPGRVRFIGQYQTQHSGRNGFSVRVLPREDRLARATSSGLVLWDVESDPNLPPTRQISDHAVAIGGH